MNFPVRALPILAAALAAAVLTSPAAAQPPPPRGSIQLRWDSCFGDGGIDNRTFACNTNSGGEQLVVSVTPDVALPQLGGVELSIRVFSSTPSVPTWWQFQSGTGCRLAGHVSVSLTPPSNASACRDPWLGTEFTTMLYNYPWDSDANLGNLRVLIGAAGPIPVNAGEELYIATLVVSHARTTGAGSCAGCATPIGIGLHDVRLVQSGGAAEARLVLPLPGTNSDRVTFQPGYEVLETLEPQIVGGWTKSYSLVSETDSRRSTWGGVKALYR